MERYNLNKNDFSKLQFELKPLSNHFLKNKNLKPSKHDYFQIIWFKNSGNHYLDFEIVPHKDNTLFLINQNQTHHFCQNSSNEGYLIKFKDNFLSDFCTDILARFTISIFNEIEKNHIELTDSNSQIIEGIANNILQELTEKKENHLDIVLHQFLNMLYYIERIKNKQIQQAINTDFYKVVTFKKLIVKNFNQSLSIQEYASKLNISSKKLTLLSKKHTSLTPGNLIKELKILEAKRLLSNQNIHIKEIAFILGFDQPTYFTKFFKKATLVTPKQFQNEIP